ncbi:MAG: CotH kinase family protein [Cyclobacteriaceae bacterium]
MKVFRLFLSLPLLLTATLLMGQVTLTSSNLPIIVINTNGVGIPDEPKIAASMGIINNVGSRNSLTDPFNDFSGTIGIELRGSSSQMFPKKQYGIEVRDALGNGLSVSLLGMPAESDWILSAPYDDKSLIRDALAYHLGLQMGRYAPRTRFCELVLNNSYMGIYVLTEKIKRDKNRVNVHKMSNTDVAGDALTGGYLLKIDKNSGNPTDGWTSSHYPYYVTSGQTIYIMHDYPDGAHIVQAQRSYIQQFVGEFEDVLAGPDFKNPTTGYNKYIDVDSFIDYFLMQEVSKNPDSYRLSTYFHKFRDSDGGKLAMGPIWDFNLGFGDVDYCTQGNPEGFVYQFNQICSQDFWLVPFWWDRLMMDDFYRNRMGLRWSALREGKFSTASLHAYVDSVTTVLKKEAVQRNFAVWPVLGQYVWPNYYVGATYDAEVQWLKNWITDRMTWLDRNLPKAITGLENTNSDVQVFPNPSQGHLTVQYALKSAGQVRIQWSDAAGRMISDDSFAHEGPGQFQQQYVMPAPGWYVYKLMLPDGNLVTGKLIRAN